MPSPSPKLETCSDQDLHYLPSDQAVFSCKNCSCVIALQDELCSKGFTGSSGTAYLMNSTINTNLGEKEERKLITGTHTCADLLCASCGISLGWKYLKTPTAEQKYKENRYILEQARIVKENNCSEFRVPDKTSRASSNSAPALNGSRSNFDPLHTIVLGPDEYSAPGRIESFATLPCTDPTRTLASNHEDPSSPNADGSDDVPGLTHSPTPSLTKSDDENIFVDVQSLRPLLGWTTIKKINYQTNMVDDQVVGISATSVRVNNMTVQIFSGMEEMKAVVWQTFRPCGKIGSLDTTVIIWISITVFREHEDMYLHTVQVDFEDADSATRALSLYRIYFHNLFWRTLRISRRAYNQSNWRLVRKSELAILQQKLLDSESRKSKFALPARLQVEYSKLFDTDYTLGLGAERYEDIREFSELSEEHTPPLLTLEDTSYHADPGTTAKSSSDWSLRSASPVVVSPDAVVLASTRSAIETLKKADVSRRERKEKKQMQEGVHPDLVGLVGHAWSSGEQAVEEAEVEVEVKVQVGREKNGASEDWIDLLGPV